MREISSFLPIVPPHNRNHGTNIIEFLRRSIFLALDRKKFSRKFFARHFERHDLERPETQFDRAVAPLEAGSSRAPGKIHDSRVAPIGEVEAGSLAMR